MTTHQSTHPFIHLCLRLPPSQFFRIPRKVKEQRASYITSKQPIHLESTSLQKRAQSRNNFANNQDRRSRKKSSHDQIHSCKMKVFSNEVTYNYSWEEVSTGNWRKYCPWNDKSTHVVAVDILSRRVDPGTGILRTERLITCKQGAPKWLSNMFGAGDVSHVYETSYVDPIAKKVTMLSHNLSWTNVLNVRESVVYKPAENDPANKTRFVQDAQVTALCGGWQKIKNSVEEAGIARFAENAAKGREGFESVLRMSRRVFHEENQRQNPESSTTATSES